MQSTIQLLRNQLHHHSHLYYVLGRPEITDEQYDLMFKILLLLEEQYPKYVDRNSPTQHIGSDITAEPIRLTTSDNPQYQTTFKYISHNISKHRVIMPIAHFESFIHNGTKFSKAKINYKTNPKTGESITVSLVGGIIPQLNYPNGEERTLHTCPACHQPLQGGRCINETWCPSRNHTADIVKQYTRWEIGVELMATPGGKAAAQAACMNKNALVVLHKKEKYTYLIIADTLLTLANVAVTLGEIDPMKHEYQFKSREQLLQEARDYAKKSQRPFSEKFNY